MTPLLEDDLRNIWHPFSPLAGEPPVVITSAKGIYLFTEDGRRIVDAVSSWWVNIHGHSHPVIAEAIYRQARRLEHVIFAGFTHEPAIELSQKVLSIVPSAQQKVFFSDNGSTAVEVALKMAIQYWFNVGKPKQKIIAIEGAYHGDTFGAMSVGDRGIFTEPFARHLFDVGFLPWPDDTNDEEVIRRFEAFIAGGDVAAFVYEPLVQGAAGMRVYSAGLLSKLLRIARSNHVLCIADEVFTGFGRTGRLFASHYLDYQPDLMALSKGLTGGTMALGVTTCSGEVYQAFNSNELSRTFFHGHSFTANPIACASANASFDLLMTAECKEAIGRISESQRAFAARLAHHPMVSDVRCLGTILALEVKSPSRTSYTNSLKQTIYRYFLERGILLRPLGNVIYFLPSYVFTDEELAFVYQEISGFLDTLQGS